MPVEMRMWRIDGDEPKPLTTSVLPAEKDLHEFLKRDPSLLGERLLVIGSEVITPYGSRLDLLAIDADGNLQPAGAQARQDPARGRRPGARLRLVGLDTVTRRHHRHRHQAPRPAVRGRVRGRLRKRAARRAQRRPQPHHRGCRARRQLGADRQLPSRLRCPGQRGLLLLSRGRRASLPRPLLAYRVGRRDTDRDHGKQEEQARRVERQGLVRLLRRR